MRDEIPWCLDWREICDGKVDCWPIPVDEQYCQILEENQCELNEYRCRNGQCIPETFLLDNFYSPDCLDRTDEDVILTGNVAAIYPNVCRRGHTAFWCTDTTYSHWSNLIIDCNAHSYDISSCGVRREKFESSLLSYQANTHITEICWAIMICLVYATQRISLVSI